MARAYEVGDAMSPGYRPEPDEVPQSDVFTTVVPILGMTCRSCA